MHKKNIQQPPPAKLLLIQAAASNATNQSKEVANPSEHLLTCPGNSGEPDAPLHQLLSQCLPRRARLLILSIYPGSLRFDACLWLNFATGNCRVTFLRRQPLLVLESIYQTKGGEGGEGSWRQHFAMHHGDQQ